MTQWVGRRHKVSPNRGGGFLSQPGQALQGRPRLCLQARLLEHAPQSYFCPPPKSATANYRAKQWRGRLLRRAGNSGEAAPPNPDFALGLSPASGPRGTPSPGAASRRSGHLHGAPNWGSGEDAAGQWGRPSQQRSGRARGAHAEGAPCGRGLQGRPAGRLHSGAGEGPSAALHLLLDADKLAPGAAGGGESCQSTPESTSPPRPLPYSPRVLPPQPAPLTRFLQRWCRPGSE